MYQTRPVCGDYLSQIVSIILYVCKNQKKEYIVTRKNYDNQVSVSLNKVLMDPTHLCLLICLCAAVLRSKVRKQVLTLAEVRTCDSTCSLS